jgi:hypothetical protein
MTTLSTALRALITAGLATIAACGKVETAERAKPSHLPPEAAFVGGIDGGEWLACEGIQDGVLHCRIFDPITPAYLESWFRYCPQFGGTQSGQPAMLDWELGLRLSSVQLRRDRPDVYHPAPNDTDAKIRHEQELIDKYYQIDGVNSDCTPVMTADSAGHAG